MITLVYPVHPSKRWLLDVSCPAILCDVCGKLIDVDHPGLLAYIPEDPRSWHVHNVRCARVLEQAVGVHLYTRVLTDWISQLVYNFEHPLIGSTVEIELTGDEFPVVAVKTTEDGEEISA